MAATTNYGATDELPPKKPASGAASKLVVTDEGRKADKLLDTHQQYVILV